MAKAVEVAMLAYAKAVLDVEADEVDIIYQEGYSYSEYTQADACFDIEFLFEGKTVRVFNDESAAKLFQDMLKWEDDSGR